MIIVRLDKHESQNVEKYCAWMKKKKQEAQQE